MIKRIVVGLVVLFLSAGIAASADLKAPIITKDQIKSFCFSMQELGDLKVSQQECFEAVRECSWENVGKDISIDNATQLFYNCVSRELGIVVQ